MPLTKNQIRRLPALDNLEILHAQITERSFPVHFHSTYVVEWVIAGSDRCSRADVQARSGEVFVHGPKVPHTGESNADEPLRYHACYPSPRLVADLLGVQEDELPAVSTGVANDRKTVRATQRLFRGLADAGSAKAMRGSLREVMARVHDTRTLRSSERGMERALLTAAVERARDHLDANVTQDTTGEELARVAGLSRFHLLRAFKAAVGVTPKQYVISQRVARARASLAAGTPIAEVAALTGFADQSHLHRQFLSVTGATPGQVRGASQDAASTEPWRPAHPPAR